MKKYILSIFLLYFMFIGHINALQLTVDTNGELSCDNYFGHCDGKDDWYELDGDTLYIYHEYDQNDVLTKFSLTIQDDINIVVSDNTYVSSISLDNANLDITSSKKTDNVQIDSITGTFVEEINIHDINMTYWSGLGSLNTININDANIKQHSQYSGVIANNFNGPSNRALNVNINNSSVEVYQLNPKGDLSIVNSTVNVGDDLYYFNTSNSSKFEIKNSNVTADASIDIRTDTNTLIEDSTIETYNMYRDDNLTNNILYCRDYINNSNVKTNYIRDYNLVMDNTTLIANNMEHGSINATKSNITLDSAYNPYILLLKDSKMTVTGTDKVEIMTDDIDEFRALDSLSNIFEVINSELTINGYVETYNAHFKDSTIKMGDLYTYYGDGDTYTSFKLLSENSKLDIGYVQTYDNIELYNSSVKSKGMLAYSNPLTSTKYHADLIIHDSELLIDNDTDNNSSIGLVINDLDFKNSLLVSKSLSNAFISDEDVTTHNLAGINVAKTIMPMNSDTETYSFYDNNDVTKYVEIRTPLKVTFKIVNGTWKDGTSGDKIVESYYFGSIKDIDVPKDMVPNSGYKNGSWDKQIVYDDLKQEYVYTYKFIGKDEKPKKEDKEEKDEEEDENEVEAKVYKNPNTGAFTSFITIGILSVGCIYVLKYIKDNKPFNKI